VTDPTPGPDPASPAPEPAQLVELALLGEPRSLRRREVSVSAGVSLLSARRFWRALGFPNVDDELVAFTATDLVALQQIAGLVREGSVDEATALALARSIGRSTDRMASWQVQLLAESVAAERAADPTSTLDARHAAQVARAVVELSDRLEPLIAYAWRRHLAAAVERLMADAETAPDPDHDPDDPRHDGAEHQRGVRSVGFADLVSFTRLVRRLSERDLAALVQRFEALASDIVSAHGGRVIKTVGDEVLFAAATPSAAAAIALDIASVMAEDDLLPDVRSGLATGPVVMRLGDVFGTTVNRASRLTGIAHPGTVLVDDTTATALDAVSGFELEMLRRRPVRGLGMLRPWRLVRASPRRSRVATDEQLDE
jgi:adenylate cyclase